MPARLRKWAPWALLLTLHALPPLLFFGHGGQIPDESAYEGLARQIVDNGEYRLDFGAVLHPALAPNTHYAPGWPGLLAAAYRIFGSQGFRVSLGLAWWAVIAAAWWLAAVCKLAPRWRWAFLAWVSLNPLLIFYHLHVMSEPLAIALGMAILASGIAFLSAPAAGTLSLFAVVSALAHLTRSQLLLPIAAVWIVGLSRLQPWTWLRWLVLFTGIHLAVISPWLWRMARVGAPGLSTEHKLGLNLYLFNHPDLENPYFPSGNEKVTFPEGIENLAPAERNRTLIHLALAEIGRRPLRYAGLCVRRLGYLISPLPNYYQVNVWEAVVIFLSTCFFLYTPAVVAGVARAKSRLTGTAASVLWVSLGIWYVFHALVNGSIRNRLPSDPWVALLAIVAMAQFFVGRSGAPSDPSTVSGRK